MKKIQNDLLLRVANNEATERPPVWLMRQAGRILPQYRALRARLSGFKELVETPNLAAEVTLQPVDELGVDAAIIFSDILVIPEAMGLPYGMMPGKGPFFENTIRTRKDVDALLSGSEAAASLEYVFEALRITSKELDAKIPLIGFAGAPWTLFAYMIEGGGSKTFSQARKMLYKEPELSHALLQKITDTIIPYLKMKIAAGADLVQIFDSWAGILPYAQYKEFSLPYIAQICSAIDEVPVTVFAKDAWTTLADFGALDCNVIGLDWHTQPAHARMHVGEKQAFQGNLDPCLLYAGNERIKKETIAMLDAFGGRHIANLGHGVYPDTPLDGVRCFVDTVKAYRY